MALYLIVVQAHFIMNNIFEGMIWFFLPASLVITNDIFAYICGITFGRTQLIKLSPKKTVEGFVGAWVLTIVFGFAMTNVLMRYKYFICPVNVRASNSFPPPPKNKIKINLISHPRNRTSAPTSLPAFPATLTRSSSPRSTPSLSPQPPSPSPLCKCTSLSSPHLHLSSPPLAASSPRASNGPLKSKTLASLSPAMAASPTAWIANSSWVCLPLCITKVLLPCIRPMWVT